MDRLEQRKNSGHFLGRLVKIKSRRDGVSLAENPVGKLTNRVSPNESQKSFAEVPWQVSARQREEIQELLQEFADVFTGIPGTTNLEEHRIETTTNEPVRVKEHQMTYAVQAVIKEEVEAMLEADIIEPSKAAFNSPVEIVRTKDGSIKQFILQFTDLAKESNRLP